MSLLKTPLETYQGYDFLFHFRSRTVVDPNEVGCQIQGPLRRDCEIMVDAKALDQCLAVPLVGIKLGCRVILLRNLDVKSLDQKLVNGSMGTVVGWADPFDIADALTRPMNKLGIQEEPRDLLREFDQQEDVGVDGERDSKRLKRDMVLAADEESWLDDDSIVDDLVLRKHIFDWLKAWCQREGHRIPMVGH